MTFLFGNERIYMDADRDGWNWCLSAFASPRSSSLVLVVVVFILFFFSKCLGLCSFNLFLFYLIENNWRSLCVSLGPTTATRNLYKRRRRRRSQADNIRHTHTPGPSKGWRLRAVPCLSYYFRAQSCSTCHLNSYSLLPRQFSRRRRRRRFEGSVKWWMDDTSVLAQHSRRRRFEKGTKSPETGRQCVDHVHCCELGLLLLLLHYNQKLFAPSNHVDCESLEFVNSSGYFLSLSSPDAAIPHVTHSSDTKRDRWLCSYSNMLCVRTQNVWTICRSLKR